MMIVKVCQILEVNFGLFSDSDIATLKSVLDPNAPSREYGMDLYDIALLTLTHISVMSNEWHWKATIISF